jgi:hypothetical protein
MCLGTSVVVGPDGAAQLQLMRAERAIRGAWLQGSISTREGEASVYLNT